MKKIITIALVAAALFCAVSCVQQPGLTLSPSEITIKVGEEYLLHPGTVGSLDLDLNKIVRIISDDGIAYFDDCYVVHGYKAGTTRVGIGWRENTDDQTFKYTAYTTVHVTE